MNICVYGTGAIGSLFAAILSKQNMVECIARKTHVHAVKNQGLTILGKTQFQGILPIYESIDELQKKPDLIILTVKSYDTSSAAKDISRILQNKTSVLTIQNGLDNIKKITTYIPQNQVLGGITSHGSFFLQPGIIKHTGIGKTRIGEINGELSTRIRSIQTTFIQSGIPLQISENIMKDIWKKGIVNACINPLTAIFHCKNGYLLENPILKNLLQLICTESAIIANNQGYNLDPQDMLAYTIEVIQDTKENYSSMLQSIRQKKKTEIDAINGTIALYGNKNHCPTFLNEIITHIIHLLYR